MERLTISHGIISFYSDVINKCSNQNYPPIKEQFDNEKKSYEIAEYEYIEYSTDELKAIYARLAELEDKLESGQLVEFPRVRLLAEEGDDKLFSVEWLDKESGDIRSCFCLSEKILKQTLKELQSK